MKKTKLFTLAGILCMLFLALSVPAYAAKLRGLQQEGSDYYYYRKGEPVTNCWKKIDGNKYYFGEDGKAYRKYQQIGDSSYYFNADGTLQYSTFLKGKKLYRINPLTGEVLKVISKNSKMICLTFDDGPWNSSTDSVIRTLKANNVAATYFIIGSNTQYYGSKLKAEYALGCDIGNHTWSHLVGTSSTSVSTFVNEIQNGNKALERYGIPAAKYFRAPGGGVMGNGKYNAATEAAARQLGLPVFYWSKQSNDCAGASVSSIISNCTSNLSDGHIVLMHDSYATTAQALPSILRILKQQNYEPVTLTEFAMCRGITYHAGSLYSRYDPQKGRMLKYTPGGSSFYWGAE